MDYSLLCGMMLLVGIAAKVDPPRALVTTTRRSAAARTTLTLRLGNPYDWLASPIPQNDTNVEVPLAKFDFRSLACDYTSNTLLALNLASPQGGVLVTVNVQLLATGTVTKRLSAEDNPIAVDWLSKNVYWADKDPAANHIAVASYITGKSQLIRQGLDTPVALGVAPLQGLLFWIEGGNSRSISRSTLAGRDVRRIIDTAVVRPVVMAIDQTRQLLLWFDEGHGGLQSVTFDGLQRRTLWRHTLVSSGYTGLDVFGDIVFVMNGVSNTVDVVNTTTQTRIKQLNLNAAGESQVTSNGLATLAPEQQLAGTGPCDVNNGGCQDLCVHRPKASAACLCDFGFDLGQDGATCHSAPIEDNFVLGTDPGTLKVYQFELASGKVHTLPVDFQSNPVALLYHPVKRLVYWTDVSDKLIKRASLDGAINEVAFNRPPASIVDGLALDMTTDRLYFTDTGLKIVGYMKEGSPTKVLLNTGVASQPRAIVLDIFQREMYWTDWGSPARIQKANMEDGSDRVDLVNTDLGWPNGLAVDFTKRQMYWCDAQANKIESSNLDGSGRVVLLQESVTSHFFGLALDEHFLFVSDWTKRYIRRINRQTVESAIFGTAFLGKMNGIHLYNSSFTNYGLVTPVDSTTPGRPVTIESDRSSDQTEDAMNSTTVLILSVVITGIVVMTITVTVGIVIVKKRRRMQPEASTTEPTDPPVPWGKPDLYNLGSGRLGMDIPEHGIYLTPMPAIPVYEEIRDSRCPWPAV